MSAPPPPVVILAGGLAKRLRPLTEEIPKALVPVNGEPFLTHQLRLLRDRSIDRVVLCIGYRGQMIRDFAGDGGRFGLSIDYSSDWPNLRGTAGAVHQALPFLGEELFVLYGDSYLPCDYAAVHQAFRESGNPALMTVFANQGQWDTSNVEFADGRIVAYDKTGSTGRMSHIDYGLGVFKRSVFESLGNGTHDLATVYQDLLRHDELSAFEVTERFYEIGSPEGIRDLSEYLESQQ